MGMGPGLGLRLGNVAATGGGGGTPPVNSVAPVISGTAAVGSVLSTTDGTWTNSPTSYAYQWNRAGTPIGGATASTYTLVSADGGQTITCSVTASNAAGASSPATSNGIAVLAVPVNSVAPAITGTPSPGNVLTCSTGTWSNTPTSYTYQWKRNGSDLVGQTASTYTAVAGDVSTNLTCVVTASNASGAGTPVSTANFPLYDTDAQAYFAAVVSNGGAAITVASKAAFNTYVVGLKADGVWSLLDRLAWLGNESAIAALTDMKAPAKLWSALGSPTFSALNGYTGDGVGAYVSAIDNLTTATQFQQNSGSLFAYANSVSGTAQRAHLAQSGATSTRVTDGTAASARGTRVNANSGANVTVGTVTTGFFCGSRPDASNTSFYFNPTNTTATATNAASTSIAVNASPATFLRFSGTYSSDRVLFGGYGSTLTGAQVLALYNRSITLATALGNPT